MDIKNPDSSPASDIWERNYRDCAAKIRRIMEPTKQFLEKVFSTKRMERYFALYPNDEAKAILQTLRNATKYPPPSSAFLNNFHYLCSRIYNH